MTHDALQNVAADYLGKVFQKYMAINDDDNDDDIESLDAIAPVHVIQAAVSVILNAPPRANNSSESLI